MINYGNKKIENSEFHNIPSMRIHKEDILAQFQGKDNFEEIYEKVKKLTYDQMESIAKRMKEMMIEQFNFAVKESFEIEIKK